MKDYLLTIKIPFKVMDDIEARKIVQTKITENNELKEAEVKLQEVFNNKPPRNVKINI